jgi:hypothetical protein
MGLYISMLHRIRSTSLIRIKPSLIYGGIENQKEKCRVLVARCKPVGHPLFLNSGHLRAGPPADILSEEGMRYAQPNYDFLNE